MRVELDTIWKLIECEKLKRTYPRYSLAIRERVRMLPYPVRISLYKERGTRRNKHRLECLV